MLLFSVISLISCKFPPEEKLFPAPVNIAHDIFLLLSISSKIFTNSFIISGEMAFLVSSSLRVIKQILSFSSHKTDLLIYFLQYLILMI